MASGAVGPEEQRVKKKWSENSKVYSRRVRRKINSTNDNCNENTTATATSNLEITADVAENGKGNDVSQKSEIVRENKGRDTPSVDVVDAVASLAKGVDSQPDSQSLPAKEFQSEVKDVDSQSSPAKDVDSHPVSQKNPPSSPAKDVDSNLVAQPSLPLSPAKDVDSNLVAQPPAKDVDSHPVSQKNPPSSPAKDLDSNLVAQPNSLSSPAKDVDSNLVAQPNPPSSPPKDLDSNPIAQPNLQLSPAKDINSKSVSQPNSDLLPDKAADSETRKPVSLVAQSSPAKDVDSLPVSQPNSALLPDKEADSTTRKVVSPVTQSSLAKDVHPQLVSQPISQSSADKEVHVETRQPVSSPTAQSLPANDVDSQLVSQPISQSSPAKEANLETREPVSSPIAQSSPAKGVDSHPDSQRNEMVEVVCDDDSSSLNRQEGEVMNGNVVAPVRPVVTRVGDRVSISLLSAATSKVEARDLKRKLLSDLDQVRNLAKRLDTKEAQVYNGGLTSSADVGAGAIVTSVVGQSLSQYSTSEGLGKAGGLRANSEGVSAALNDSRPFQQLSVSVMDISRSGGGNDFVEKEKRTPKANQYYQSSDFICGKERLPPESNKKHKSSGRKKHSAGGSEFDKHIFKKCNSLLQQLMKHKFSWVFNTPVDVKGLCLHDYYDIIKHPMDLGSVKNRLSKNWYKSPSEFAEDVRLTFSNAMIYNPEGQDVHVMAVEMSNTFEQKWAEIEAEYNSKLRHEYEMGLPTPTSRLAPMPFYAPSQPTTPAPRPAYQETRHLDRSESFALPVESRMKPVYSAPVVRTPVPKKPKAKDPNKRNMTFEEKQKLSTHLQALPSEKLDTIVQIITRRNPTLCQHDEEVEVDIDSVDAETLWELDRFVTNYKKNLSKHKRKAELALLKAQTQQTMQETNPAPLRPDDPNKETAPGNPDAAAKSSPAGDGKQGDNDSGSSSSSSSSSDSGSSSSDSDSDSSSGSDARE